MNDHHNDQRTGTLSGRVVLVTGAKTLERQYLALAATVRDRS
jgi:hypothetical protein